jgi:hypothetical protein
LFVCRRHLIATYVAQLKAERRKELANEMCPLRRFAQKAWLVSTCHQVEFASLGVVLPFRVSIPKTLASVLVRCSPLALLPLGLDFRVFAISGFRRTSRLLRKSSHGFLLSFRVHPNLERPTTLGKPSLQSAPPVRFLPLQRIPAQGLGLCCWACLTQIALRLQVFSTSWRHYSLVPAGRFQTRSALGVFPSELFSSHVAVHRFRCLCPHDVNHCQAHTLPSNNFT